MKQAKWRAGLDLLVTALMLVLIVGMGWRLFGDKPVTGPPPPKIKIPLEPVSLKEAHLMGATSATIGVLLLSDFQCPACALFAKEVLPLFKQRHVDTGRVLLAFRHLPLEELHPDAVSAAAFAKCAGRSGQFWQAHDALFARSPSLGPLVLSDTRWQLRLDEDTTGVCSIKAEKELRRSVEEVLAMGIRSTPTLLIGLMEPDGRLRVSQVKVGVPQPSALDQVLDLVSMDRAR